MSSGGRNMKTMAVPLLVLSALVGCASPSGSGSIHEFFFGADIEKRLNETFLSNDPDTRREGIEYFSRRRKGLQEPYLKAYAAMTLDTHPSVRSAAVAALGRAGDAKYLKQVLAALEDKHSADVRADAAAALDTVVGEQAVGPLTQHAVGDTDLDVRIRCIRALRHYKRRDVLDTLVECMRDDRFGMRHAARESLREMTGCDGEYDAVRWSRLLAAKDDPFSLPPEAPKRPWWKLWGP